jgi:hypothetical protein
VNFILAGLILHHPDQESLLVRLPDFPLMSVGVEAMKTDALQGKSPIFCAFGSRVVAYTRQKSYAQISHRPFFP